MQSFNCPDGTSFFFYSGFEFVIVEDEDETQIATEDMREFLNFVRDAELDEALPQDGFFQGIAGTVFQFKGDLSEVFIEDADGRKIRTRCLRDFAELVRTRDLEMALQNDGIDGML